MIVCVCDGVITFPESTPPLAQRRYFWEAYLSFLWNYITNCGLATWKHFTILFCCYHKVKSWLWQQEHSIRHCYREYFSDRKLFKDCQVDSLTHAEEFTTFLSCLFIKYYPRLTPWCWFIRTLWGPSVVRFCVDVRGHCLLNKFVIKQMWSASRRIILAAALQLKPTAGEN